MKRTLFRILIPVLAVAFMAGCERKGNSDSGSPQRSSGVNMQEAADKADNLIRTTFSSVKPSLEWTHDEFDSGMCKGTPELGDVTRRAAVMTEVSEERRGALLGYIERAWKKAGYTITKVNPDKSFPAIYADANDGVLKMSLTVGYKGQFFLDVQTACVKKTTVAPPNTAVNGTEYYGTKIPEPNVRSDFWSSR